MGRAEVKFYSEHDLSTGWNLQKAEEILQAWDGNAEGDINKILCFQNIKLYFDAGIRLKRWDGVTFSLLNEKCKFIPGVVGRFFAEITDANIIDIYKKTEDGYRDDFWRMICEYKVYKRISQETFGKILDEEDVLWYVLHQKKLILQFGQIVASRLVDYPESAEWLVSHFLVAHDCQVESFNFPVEYTQEMRTQSLIAYIESENPNLNYLRLLAEAQSTKDFPIDDRLRLKARKKDELITGRFFTNNPGMPFGLQVGFKSIPDGSIEEKIENNTFYYTYSREWIMENRDYATLLNNFIYVFGYVDKCFRCGFTSKSSELGVFERCLGIKGKREYNIGITFNLKFMRAVLQMRSYRIELQALGIRIEDIFKWFFETYLKEEFNAAGFRFSPPSEGTTYAEKCKLLAISIDGVLKQYRLFCEDGYVDHELLEMSSGHIVFGSLSSMRGKKYAYTGSQEFLAEQNLLYSDQSILVYTEKTRDKYKALPEMLIRENLSIEDFQEYQRASLQWLIERGNVIVGGDGSLDIDRFRSFVLRDLFKNEVLCPEYYDDELQKRLDLLESMRDIVYVNTLFSKPEQDLLNYILNKAEFSNGLDLRNKYSHDTCSLDEAVQIQDYHILLCVMMFIIIKINEEFCYKS